MDEGGVWAVLASSSRVGRSTPADARARQLAATDGRARRAASTRARVTEAAQRLFVAQGFADTSVAEVARAAHVGVQTVYDSYPSKQRLLIGCLDAALGGADRRDGYDVTAQRWVLAGLSEADPVDRLSAQVRGSARLMGRAGAIIEVVRFASPADPDLADELRAVETGLEAMHRLFVESFAAHHLLAPTLTVEEATDAAGFVLGPQAWVRLVDAAGWAPLAWTRWARHTLLAQLMPTRWRSEWRRSAIR